MQHDDHVALLRPGVGSLRGGVWADLGSGEGAFSLALADLIGPAGTIYSVDRDRRALKVQQQAMQARFPAVQVTYHASDFTQPLDLPALDGVVMANALHFAREKDPILRLVFGYLRPGGRLILVEYNADEGNPWVPFPFSYPRWEKIAHRNGFTGTHLLGTHPSRFMREIYSAMSYRPPLPAE